MKPFIHPKVSIKEAREILCKDGEEYTDDDIKHILSFLTALAEIDYRHFQESVINKVTHVE